MERILTCVVTIGVLLAARAESITIEQCVEKARANYPAIAQYELIERTAQFSLANASKAWLPQGVVGGQVTWQNDVAAWPEQFATLLSQMGVNYPGIDKWQYRLGVDLNQQIWDGGKTAANRRAIESGAEVERRQLDVTIYDVEGRVQELYFGLLLLEGRMASLDKTAALVDSTLQQLRAMYRNGVAMASDCDQVEAKLLGLEQQKTQLEASQAACRRVLELFIGEAMDGRKLQLPDDAPKPADERPQLRLFDAQLSNVAAQERGVRAAVMPQIGAFASAYYGYPGYNMFKSMQSRDPRFNFLAGLKLTWSFGALYTRRASLDKLQIRRQQIEANRATFLFNNRLAETEGEQQIAALRRVMEQDSRIVELRRAVVRAARSQLRNGVIDTTALLGKITDAELAENDLMLHNIELSKAIYNLNHIKNK